MRLLRRSLPHPPLPARVVARPRLHARLDALRDRPVVWLHGPPGAGKTTLAACWARDLGVPVAWCTVDAADGEPVRFFTLLADAIDAAGAFVARPSTAHVDGWVAALAEALAGAVLVLDDLHALPDAGAHLELIRGLADAAGPYTVLCLCRRPVPPPLAHVLARHRVATVGGAELIATVDEVGAVTDDPDGAASLHARTGGWLAAVALPDPGALTHVVDAVTDALPEETVAALVATARLPVVSAPLAAALTGDALAGPRLAALADDGLAAVTADGVRVVPLLREVVARRATRPEWAALAVASADALAAHVRRCGAAELAAGRIETLRAWLGATDAEDLAVWRAAVDGDGVAASRCRPFGWAAWVVAVAADVPVDRPEGAPPPELAAAVRGACWLVDHGVPAGCAVHELAGRAARAALIAGEPAAELVAAVPELRVWEAMTRGAWIDARRALASAPRDASTDCARAEISLELGELPEARRWLDRAQAAADAPGVAFWTAVVRADLCARTGADPTAALGAALAMGRRYGLVDAPGWQRDRIARVLGEALRRDVEPAYARELARRHRLEPDPAHADLTAWPWRFRLRAFGGLSLAVDGQPVEVGGRVRTRQLALLQALIAGGGERVPTSWLVDALWPDADGDRAQGSLFTTLHRLRALLGDADLVRTDGGTLSLDRRRCHLDVWTLDARCARLEEGLRAGDDPAALADALLEAYPGSFLPEADDPWVIAARERWEGLFTRAADRVCLALVSAGRDHEAIEVWERALRAAPEADLLYRGLASALRSRGLAREAAAVERRRARTVRS